MAEGNVAKEVLRSVIIPSAERLVGRVNLVRLARFLTNEVRLDTGNDMRGNGERMVMRVLCERAGRNMTVLDIGANVGDWTASFMDTARTSHRRDFVVHAFEPCCATHAMLEQRLNGAPERDRTFLHACAMSDHPGETMLHVVGDGIGVNSVHRADGQSWTRTELVKLDTIDAFAKRHDLLGIAFVKSDAEGHDLHVLRGARGLLSERTITAIQFEYNWRWIMARSYLRDVFELAGTAYRIGKITRRGVEWYSKWDPELETFREGNYLLCLNECVEWFPAIRWWKLDA